MRMTLLAGLVLAALGGGAHAATPASRFTQDPYPSTYRALAAGPVLLANATVLTGTGERLEGADVLLADGKVVAVGRGLSAPDGATRVDATGKWVTVSYTHLGGPRPTLRQPLMPPVAG